MTTIDSDTFTPLLPSGSRILVTGVSGFVGTALARELLTHGYKVRGLDRSPLRDEALKAQVEMVYADMTDRLALMAAVDGCAGIAHLAAIPHPHVPNPEEILKTNVVGTGHLLEAAEKHGVKRFTLASTCCTFGIYFAHHPIEPQYLPMDEEHPALPQDLYGLSKVMCEEACAAYTRRAGIATVALRLTTVMDFERSRRKEWIRHMITDDAHRQNDLWTYIEVRDCARAFRLALENAPAASFAKLIVAARDTYSTHDIRQLIARHFPTVSQDAEKLAPFQSPYDTQQAEKHIGFIATNSWRDVPDLIDTKL